MNLQLTLQAALSMLTEPFPHRTMRLPVKRDSCSLERSMIDVGSPRVLGDG